nr:hypothetical protein [uncultured bacterium]
MKNYATVAFRKIKGAEQFNGLEIHNTREILSKNIHPHLTHTNICLKKNNYKNYAHFVSTKKNEIRAKNVERRKAKTKKKLSRFPRQVKNKKTKEFQDAALCFEFIFGYTHKALSDAEGIEYLKDAYNFAKEWFETEIISADIHLDEKTPHMHMVISYFCEEDARFIQKELSQKKLTDLDTFRDAFQKRVAGKYELIKQDGTVCTDHKYLANLEVDDLKKSNKYELEKVAEELSQKNEELVVAKSAAAKIIDKVKKMAADFIDELVITSKAIEEVDECREIFTVKKIREDLAVFLKGSSAKEIEAKGVETIMAEFEKNVYVLYSQEVPTFQDALSVVSIKKFNAEERDKNNGATNTRAIDI